VALDGPWTHGHTAGACDHRRRTGEGGRRHRPPIGEALGLAVAPSAIERIRIQLAAHTAAAGRLVEAKEQLDEVLSTGVKVDPLIRGEALLQRAVLLREMGRPRELGGPRVGSTRLHILGSVTEEFEAGLEQARALRTGCQPQAAFAAIERALGQATPSAFRLSNPSFARSCKRRCDRPTTSNSVAPGAVRPRVSGGSGQRGRDARSGRVRDRGCIPRAFLRRRRGAEILACRSTGARI